MHGLFLQELPETVDKDKTWEWTRKGDLKVETEALIFVAQEHALRTNYVKFNIDKSVESHFVGCVTKRVKQYTTLLVIVSTWHRKSTILPSWSTGRSVVSMT